MDKASIIASDITAFAKYCRYNEELGRRETWDELVTRYEDMLIKKVGNKLDKETIKYACGAVRRKEVLPSMRALQFAGGAIERCNSRLFNCAYLPADTESFFKEVMFLLLGGTGVGYSVQTHHIAKLPVITAPKRPKRWLVGDSIEGWADAIGGLMKAYYRGNSLPVFDFSDVRPKGARLITAGGKAPGPAPLRVCLSQIQGILESKPIGSKLETWEVSDIACYIADAVLSGGIRRSAMIALFDLNDEKMLHYKSGNWWELNPERGRANISAVAVRDVTTKPQFEKLWEATRLSGAGEPGIFWTNDREWGTNPCAEIALRPRQMCNLATINFATVRGQADFERRVTAATILGTIQASFTDFHYLSPEWQETCEEDALLGVSLTGPADNPKGQEEINFKRGADLSKDVNFEIATALGINPSARITTIKPEGTASLILGTSSGVHARHAKHYIRRFRFKKNEAIAQHLMDKFPKLTVDDVMSADTIILELPQKAPEGSILRTEAAINLLERVSYLHKNWIKPGHREGANTHNVSCTVSIKPDEWDSVGLWMWMHRDSYTGLSVLPYSEHSYTQPPFEDCTEDEYNRRMADVGDFDITQVMENEDETALAENLACHGGSCEL